MRLRDRVLRFCTNYLLGTEQGLYQNVLVWDVQHNSDYYLVMICIRGAPA